MAQIRPMRPDDATAIHELHGRAVRESCAPLVDPAVVEAWLHSRTPEGYLSAADQGGEHFWVAEDEHGCVIGFASWRDDELVALFVDPDFQRQGLGQRLYAACVTDAHDRGHRLTRLRSTRNAVSFYEALGFRRLEDGWEMKRGQRIPHVKMERRDRPHEFHDPIGTGTPV
jgi:GNAT superfamily N-acetyltransferase